MGKLAIHSPARMIYQRTLTAYNMTTFLVIQYLHTVKPKTTRST